MVKVITRRMVVEWRLISGNGGCEIEDSSVALVGGRCNTEIVGNDNKNVA